MAGAKSHTTTGLSEPRAYTRIQVDKARSTLHSIAGGLALGLLMRREKTT